MWPKLVYLSFWNVLDSWWIKVEAEGAVGNNMEHHGQYAPPGIVQIDKNCEKV